MTEYLTTRELAELLRIKERKVYDLASSGTVPCSKATGKLLFPRTEINAWLAQHRSGPQPLDPAPLVFLGSHDPLLEWALRESNCGIPTYFDGSSDGLQRFTRREGIATGLHLYHAKDESWNIAAVREQCAGLPVVLVEWVRRQRGLIYNRTKQPSLDSFSDISGGTVTPRQSGAGAQALLLQWLEQQGLPAGTIKWAPAVRTEEEAVKTVVDGRSDIAFGLQTLATQYRLDFLPVIEERFDLLMTRHAWFEPPLQTFIRFCQSEVCQAYADRLAGYDFSGMGTVHFNAEAS